MERVIVPARAIQDLVVLFASGVSEDRRISFVRMYEDE